MQVARTAPAWGFGAGTVTGVLVTAIAATLLGNTSPLDLSSAGQWTSTNLGHAVWLFAAVLVLFALHLKELARELGCSRDHASESGLAHEHFAAPPGPNSDRIARLDQITDVWIQLFVGIGVIWTAIGMRSALIAALGEGNTGLEDSADSVLRKLVDGGILLALSTTIVGGIGSYLMRLVKTCAVGARLFAHYQRDRDGELRRIATICADIRARLPAEPKDNG